MATLEKIRKRSTLLLIVVGAALLAFIIGDFFTSGRTVFGNGMTVAKVGDTKIDIQDFQRRVEQVTQQQQQQNSRQNDAAKTQNDVLTAMIQETLLDKEIEALGIQVTDFELQSLMLGANAHPAMYQFAQRFGVQTPDQLYDIAFNPVKYDVPAEQAEQVKTLWLEQEKAMERELKLGKLQSLLAGTLTANKLDAKGYYDENATAKKVAMVAYPYAKVDSVDVTAADIKAAYNDNKELFKNDKETYRITYISVIVEPSATDREEAKALVDTMVAQLNVTPELEAANASDEFVVTRQTAQLGQIRNTLLKNFIADANVGQASNISFTDNTYTIAKLLDKKQAVDSVNIDLVAYQGDAAGRDSLYAALTAGKAIEEVAAMPGFAGVQTDQWQSIARAPESDAKTRILTAPVGQYVLLDSANGATQFVRVNTRTAPATIFDYAIVTYKLYPSDNTVTTLRENLEQYAATVTAADSIKSADAMALGYTVMPGTIDKDAWQLPGVPASRNAVKWVLGAKKGEVSPVLDNANNDRYILVALRDIVKPGYIDPNTDYVKNFVESIATANKKAAVIRGKYADIDLAAIAAENGASVDTITAVFGQRIFTAVGTNETKLNGAVAATPVGAAAAAVDGVQGVIFYQVVDETAQGRPYDYNEAAARYNQQYGAQSVMQQIFEIMKHYNKVDNRLNKFYND